MEKDQKDQKDQKDEKDEKCEKCEKWETESDDDYSKFKNIFIKTCARIYTKNILKSIERNSPKKTIPPEICSFCRIPLSLCETDVMLFCPQCLRAQLYRDPTNTATCVDELGKCSDYSRWSKIKEKH